MSGNIVWQWTFHFFKGTSFVRHDIQRWLEKRHWIEWENQPKLLDMIISIHSGSQWSGFGTAPWNPSVRGWNVQLPTTWLHGKPAPCILCLFCHELISHFGGFHQLVDFRDFITSFEIDDFSGGRPAFQPPFLGEKSHGISCLASTGESDSAVFGSPEMPARWPRDVTAVLVNPPTLTKERRPFL